MQSIAPKYIERSVPVRASARAPWSKNTYAGIFLWVGFYLKLAGPTIGYADAGLYLWGPLLTGFLCFGVFYYVPAMPGMQSGRPLYVVGSSTFGTTGGRLMRGLLLNPATPGPLASQG